MATYPPVFFCRQQQFGDILFARPHTLNHLAFILPVECPSVHLRYVFEVIRFSARMLMQHRHMTLPISF